MANEAQISAWNGNAGAGWVKAQTLLDQLFLPFEKLLIDSLTAGDLRVLDIGCGTGATTLAAARRAGSNARCLGADVSEPMITLAQSRAAAENSPAAFVVADAQEHDFGISAFDAVISRFGVMFFDEPVRAFANLRRSTRTGGTLRCITFRSIAENPFMTAAEHAVAPLLPAMPARQPNAPGQFAFADADRVRNLLEQAGWLDVQHRPLDIPCAMPAAALSDYLTELGPVGLMLKQADERKREEVLRAASAALARYVHGDEVRLTAACWMVTATA